MIIAHAGRAHARLGASGSKRWLTCTPSARLEEALPESGTSIFAEEGTAAHELAELHLQLFLGTITKATFRKKVKEHSAGPYYSPEMEDHVQTYLDEVVARINTARARTPDAIVLLEQRLDFSQWVPDGFGTGDVLIIADGVLEIVDLKYGKGVPVSAEDNSQMRLYALGAMDQYALLYEFENVQMTIVQPRLGSVSTDEMPADELLRWSNEYVKPRAAMAAAGEGEFLPGDHCRFCSARTHCRARAMANLELAKHEFKDPPLLSVNEIGEILVKADELKKWAEDISKYAFEQAEKHGVRFPGWKLVEGRSNRIYTDKQAVAQTLLIEGYPTDVIYEPQEILGITAMEKVLGKKQFADLLDGLIIKPSGKPTLVPESDKRPELSSAASAAADFADE